jgi:hypothetical protein
MLEPLFNAYGAQTTEEVLASFYADEAKKAMESGGALTPIRTADDLIGAASTFDLFTHDGRQAFLASRNGTTVSHAPRAPDATTRTLAAPPDSNGKATASQGLTSVLHSNVGNSAKQAPSQHLAVDASAFGADESDLRQIAEVHAYFGRSGSASVSASSQARVGFATKWLKAHHAAGRLPSVHEAAQNQSAFADKIGTTCDSSLLIGHYGLEPIPSVLVYARHFEANASEDGNTEATCRALVEAGYMNPSATGSFKRGLNSAGCDVTHVYQLNGSILMSQAAQR